MMIEDGRFTGVRRHSAGRDHCHERARVMNRRRGEAFARRKRCPGAEIPEHRTIAVADSAFWSGLPAEAFEGWIRPAINAAEPR